jgi:uridine phosphorylase
VQNLSTIEVLFLPSMDEDKHSRSNVQMETFYLYHLAACWTAQTTSIFSDPPPLATNPVDPIFMDLKFSKQQIKSPAVSGPSVIRAAAAHMVFASRTSQDFIKPQDVKELERWTGEVGDLIINCNLSIINFKHTSFRQS